MDKIKEELSELCFRFLELLEIFKEKGIISDEEYEILVREKKLFIHQEKSKLSI